MSDSDAYPVIWVSSSDPPSQYASCAEDSFDISDENDITRLIIALTLAEEAEEAGMSLFNRSLVITNICQCRESCRGSNSVSHWVLAGRHSNGALVRVDSEGAKIQPDSLDSQGDCWHVTDLWCACYRGKETDQESPPAPTLSSRLHRTSAGCSFKLARRTPRYEGCYRQLCEGLSYAPGGAGCMGLCQGTWMG